MKHTPGPWRVDPRYPNDIQSLNGELEIACTCSDVLTGGTKPARGEQRANARLIAAAPDLLEALIWMVENDETFEGDTPLPDRHGATWNEINAYWIAGLNMARAAIAKATGEGE